MNATVAGAPVSFGVFELTPEGSEIVSPDELLESLAAAGYRGVDLGPEGYLGRGPELRARLDRFGLDLAGGWVQLPLTDDDAFEASLPTLRSVLRRFSEGAERGPARLPLPTLADDGSATRKAHPGRGEEVDPLAATAWHRLLANLETAARIVREAGFEPTFHHHAGTFVESPAEIDHFLAHSDVGLTLDTGHLFIAGGDPAEAIRRWGDRINHLHLKDVDVGRLRGVLSAGGGMREVWSGGAFVAFGRGDVDLEGVMEAMQRRAYDGWVVVEQDVLNGPSAPIAEFLASRSVDQRINRGALSRWV
ncbi:sugar phosphate isomerase/epimerase family protein [Microbacterium album]|uniref:Inosose dehydratase n=1 Tax=Microbacterium album TaxID=2053191 RepID=A0A917II04_9MICO|nr:sugar phosphate isomerase/epimerase [Microbacterium album]GGH48552.1 inosose dehydratase [Microbacterium album]